MELGQWMKENRWNVTQLAKKTGLNRITIKSIIEKKTEITLRTAFIIRDFTKNEVTLEEMYIYSKSPEVKAKDVA